MMSECEKDEGWKYLRHSREKILEFQNKPYDSKKNFWKPDAEEGYVACEIKEIKGDNATVTIEGGSEQTVKKDMLQEMNPPKFEMNEDMSNLTFLNDASVLYNLRSRYATLLIYTYSGLFCVVINPYKRLPIYTDSMARLFMGKRRTEMPPHLFAVSDEAYRNMLQNHENQSMLITGESGAGKTENTKKVISYFASVGAAQAEALGVKKDGSEKKVTLEDQIVQTNPVLEAFGNAKTVRNNNSSRFGKFIRIHFNKVGRVASCDIEHYLLEKSRVVRQAPGERCYHIFYQIFSDHKPELKTILKLNKPLADYWFVAQAELTIDGMNDTEEFALTDEAFTVLNFSDQEKLDCYRLMSALMHMGNMKFKQRPREEQAEVDETEEAQYAAEMYGVDSDLMLNALIKPRVRVGTEWVAKGQSVEQVNWAIGAVVKGLYARVFHWLVAKCNMTLDQKGLNRDYFIGVLDIAGFEIFDFNSFEQLWINFVNEKLQQFFNHHMFVLEQEEYAREGIQWTFIDFGLDLQACIELIEKPMGIISMLDEECIVPKATDQTLAQKLVEQHLGKHPNFEKPKPPKGKQAEAHFAMRHYAGTVRYNVTNWLEKNKDPLNDTLVAVLKGSKQNNLLNTIWADYTTQEEAAAASKSGGKGKKGKSGAFSTVSNLYRESLNNLMNMLHKTHPHFIRCIIPNEKKTCGLIDAALVLNQLTCNGVLEGIRICRKGFPNRSLHADFVLRYSLLAGEEARANKKDPKLAAAAILGRLVNNNQLTDEQFRVGHTKIFFKAGVVAHIEDLRDVRQNELITGIQNYCRRFMALIEYRKRKAQEDSYGIVQKNIRAWNMVRTDEWYKLYGWIKPQLKGNKMAEEVEKLDQEFKELSSVLKKEEEARKVIEAEHKKFAEERAKLLEDLEMSRSGGAVIEDKISSLSAAKAELERSVNDVKDRLADQDQRTEEVQRQMRRVEKDRQGLNEQISSLESAQQKIEEEKKEREERIRSLHEEMAKKDAQIAEVNREKKKNDEANRKMAENLQAEEEKNTQSNRNKVKLERSIEDIEDTLERDRRQRLDLEKSRKKAENELAVAEEQIDEITRRKAEIEQKLQAVEEEWRTLNNKLNDEITLVARLNREIKEQQSHIQSLEEELDAERHARAKTDKSKSAIQMMLDDLNDSLDDENGKTTAQIELQRRKEGELARLRMDLEQANQNHEGQLAVLRKKNADDLANLTERLERMQASKAKIERDKQALRQQLDDVLSQVNEETKNKSEQERLSKMYESQVAELQARCDDQHRLIQDYVSTKTRLEAENQDMQQQVEDGETQLTALSKRKAQSLAQLEEGKKTVEEEHQERQNLSATVKNLEHEIEYIHECIEREGNEKEELLRQLSKAKSEAQQWKSKIESEGLIAGDELEEERRRRANKKLEIQDLLQDVNNKIITVEKANSRLISEAEDARSEMERNRALISQLEKKQSTFDRIIEDWRRQCDELSQETERSQQEARRNAADVYALQTASTSLSEQVDDLRREGKNLTHEVKDLNEQLGAGGRLAHDVAKKELQHALDETESALEVEESKVLRLQTEVSQIRQEIDRRIQEKEEDFESTLKNHQRALESIQTSLETESKSKHTLLQCKKKLESEIHALELNLDVANKSNVESQKMIKKMMGQIVELQGQLEEAQRHREEYRENYLIAEKKLQVILTEKDELAIQRETLEQQKAKLDTDVNEQRSIKTETQNENLQLSAAKRQVENEIQIAKSELDKALADLKHTEEAFKKVNGDVTRLSEELRQEQAHAEHVDRLRKGLELQIKELHAKLEDAEQHALRLSQRTVEKLQQDVRMRERELEAEQKRHKEAQKNLAKCDRDVRERKFELEEQRKNAAKMQDLIEKLNSKLKSQKKALEEAEEVANGNMQKVRKIVNLIDHADERAEEAEHSLLRIKTKIRGRTGLMTSATQPINGDLSKGWQYLRMTREQMLEEQSKPYDSKKNCWVADPEEGYVAAEIKSSAGDDVTVVTVRGNEQTLKKELVQEMNPPKFEKTEDMSNLTFLNDASTYSGLFCVVINPYKRLPIYTDSVARMYMGKRRTEMPPHLFAVSDQAYRNMLQDHENQSMLITGESGAGCCITEMQVNDGNVLGKTENTKKVIAYFASVGASQQEAADARAGVATDEKKVTLEDQIVQTNPVLEAFGNAKTVRNNNSSRFGKFIRIQFNRAGRVASCDIEHYLLEKSRVIRQAPGERCYHIFYQIYSGYKPELIKELQLDKPLKDYWFVAQAELTIDGVNDKEEHQLTDEAFDIMNFSPDEKMNCYRIMAALMHMGNMKFKQRPREEQAEPDGTDEAEKAAAMYGVDCETFLKALTKPRVKVGTEWVSKGQNQEQVNWAVGAMSKGLYARVFHWLVKKCNMTLDQVGLSRDHFIGVLDIAGFEIFDFNSFEQLWINFVNEKLQQFFNHHMFVLEQEEYAREGIQWTFIDFGLDLQACIELIEKPMGIISMLDEECIVPKATDQTLAQKLVEQHLGKHPNFEKPKPPKGKQAEAHFAMRHYAGTVRYNVTNWLEKNKDPLNDTVVSVMKGANANPLLLEVWSDYTTQEEAAQKAKEGGGGGGGKKKGKSGSFMTVSMMYRESLNNLMTMLNSTHPHFIRCIIPNEKKQSGMIDAALVLNQLTCNGVLEGIRICRKGFPNRTLHADFKQRYSVLAADAAKSSEDPKVCAGAIMQVLINDGKLTEENFRIGATKVFFKAGIVALLEDFRDEKLGAIMTGFQATIRWYLGLADRRRRMQQRAGLLILQRNIRSWCTYGKVKPLLKAGKEAEELEKVAQRIAELEAELAKEVQLRKDAEDQGSKLLEEKNKLFSDLESSKSQLSESEDRLSKLQSQHNEVSRELNELHDRLEDRNADLQRGKKKLEGDLESLKKQIQDLEMSLRKSESEKQSKDHQIRSLQDEMQQLDENLAKSNREKKAQEEANRKLMEDLQAEEDKGNHSNKLKAKLEQQLDDLEDTLEREKRARGDLDKQKRKVEGELKIANENIDEANKQKADLQSNLQKKEAELHSLSSKLEDEQSLAGKLNRQIKEQQSQISELTDELENERQSRQKADRAKGELQRELEELSERLDEQGGATQAQIEVGKKRDAEIAKLRRDLEEAHINNETALGSLRKKHTDAIAELSDQLEALQKQKQKADKERQQAIHDCEDLQNQLDSESSARLNQEKLVKQYELQLSELTSKCDEQTRTIQDFTSLKGRLQNETGDLGRQLEDAESQLNNLHRLKSQLASQLEEAKRTADEEARERQTHAANAKNLQHELDQVREMLDDEVESKAEVLRQLSKANAEIQQWKARFESEGLLRGDEIEEAKRRQTQRIQELEEALGAANSKIQSLDKTRSRLVGDLDDAQVDVERANSLYHQLENKQKGFDRIVDEWKKKTADLESELDAAQRDARNAATDLFRAKAAQDEAHEAVEGLRRENRSLAQEIKDLTDQLGEGGRSVHELQKMLRRLEQEKEELGHALDESEAALEAEESKVLRAQVEVSQIRSEIEKRIQEKEEEFENTRKNHQRALESMQATLEAEVRAKQDLLRIKKKLESDVNDLEISLDHASKANVDAQKTIKRTQDQIRELQMQVDENQRNCDDMREQYLNAEKRLTILQSERDELVVQADSLERARRQAETEATDFREQANDLNAQCSSLNGLKRKLEGELQALHADLDETLNEYKASEERSKKAMADASRLAEELRQEQEHSLHNERLRKGLEMQIKEMQVRLDEAEQAALKGGKKIISKLEERIRALESELDAEQRRYQESNKNLAKQDRRLRELQFQVEEDKKAAEKYVELVDKLQGKLKSQKKALEEAEEVANTNLAKYRQLTHQLEDAESRADEAENNLSRVRAKSRSAASVAPSGGGLASSASSAAVLRSSSRARISDDY
ncbi:Myosin head [Aphelenchoides besseyi]|nr:Myosin head [Aphelenchoides besseyi]